MQHSKSLSRLVAAPLAVLAILVPAAAQAMPQDPRQLDMHASTVQKAQPAVAQDLRTEAAVDAARAPQQDLRTEAAVDATRAPRLPVGLPTWPSHPETIPAVATESDGDGITRPISFLALAGAMLIGGGVAVSGILSRRPRPVG